MVSTCGVHLDGLDSCTMQLSDDHFPSVVIISPVVPLDKSRLLSLIKV